MKNTYDVTTPTGSLIGRVKAKDLNCAAKQARRKFWPKGESRFRFSVGIHREPSSQNAKVTHDPLGGRCV